MKKQRSKNARSKEVRPPANYKQMVDKNVDITKLCLDIVDLYLGALTGSVKNNQRSKDESGK